MRNQSQRELLDEGLWSTMAGVTRGLRNATGSIASIALPKTTAALKKGASIASGAIERIRSGSITAAVGSFLDSEEGKRSFEGIGLGDWERLGTGSVFDRFRSGKNDFKINIDKGYYISRVDGQVEKKDLAGGSFIIKRSKRDGPGGFDNEIVAVLDSNNQRMNDKPVGKFISAEDDTPAQDGTSAQGGEVTSSTFKQELNKFKLDKFQDKSTSYSPIAVNEFVRKLATDANNMNVVKDLPDFIERVKKNNAPWSNNELVALVNNLKLEGILKS